MHAWTGVFGSFLCAGCAGATWVRGRGLESGMGAWKWCMASRVGGVPLVGSRFRRRGRVWALCGRAREGLGDAVSSRSAGVEVCVGAWSGAASGGSFGAFAPVAI